MTRLFQSFTDEKRHAMEHQVKEKIISQKGNTSDKKGKERKNQVKQNG